MCRKGLVAASHHHRHPRLCPILVKHLAIMSSHVGEREREREIHGVEEEEDESLGVPRPLAYRKQLE